MEQDFITLGTAVCPLYQRSPLTLTRDARLRHTFVLGQTGTGKTTLLQRMAIEDLHAGNGFAFLDPHGDAARELINYVPVHRMQDVIYLRPGDTDRAFGFNIFDNIHEHEKDRLTQEIVSTFRYRWADSWGARMENIFKYSVRALLDIPQRKGGATLLALPMFLNRADYRAWVLHHSQNIAVRHFFTDEFNSWDKRRQVEFVQPILNKVDQLLLSDVLRNVLGQTKSTIDVDYIMNHRKVLILDLDKGAIGADDADLIGSLFVTAFQLATMRRSHLDPNKRIPFYAYLDEFHSFTTGSFASIMSESRKYGLGLVLAGQYLDQIEINQVQSSVFGNCGNIICFRIGNKDAEVIAPTVDAKPWRLEELATGQAAARYLEDGYPIAVNLETHTLNHTDHVGRAIRVKRYSRRFTVDTNTVAERHTRWLTSLHSRITHQIKKPHARNHHRGRL